MVSVIKWYILILLVSATMVYAERIPVNQRMDRDGNTFTVYAYDRYNPLLERPVLERVVPCPDNKLICALYGDERIDVFRDYSFSYRGILYGNELIKDGRTLRQRNSIPFIGSDNTTIHLTDFWGSGYNYSVILQPNIFEDAVVIPEQGEFVYTYFVDVEGVSYNETTKEVSVGNRTIMVVREPIVEAYDQDNNLTDVPVEFIVSQMVDSLLFHVVFNITGNLTRGVLDPSFEFDETEGIQDTYIQKLTSSDNGASANLLVQAEGVAAPLNSSATVLLGWNVTGIDNSSVYCNVTNANASFRFIRNVFTQTKAGLFRVQPNLRNWTDSANWFNKSAPCSGTDLNCRWNTTGAQGEGDVGNTTEHDSRIFDDRAKVSGVNIQYSWGGTSQTITIFNNNAAFRLLVQQWVNESRTSYANGMQMYGVYNVPLGQTIKMIMRSSEAADATQRPHLTFECEFVNKTVEEDNCVAPPTGHWIPTENITCIDKDLTLDCATNKGLIINPGIKINFTRTNLTTYFIWQKIGAFFHQSERAGAKGC